MSRYITTTDQDIICKYLAEWETGIYGKKLTWAILSKAFCFSRQALTGNKNIKAAYDKAKKKLKDAVTQIDVIDDITEEHGKLRKRVQVLEARNNELIQKYLRWQYNTLSLGISIEQLNTAIPPSFKQEMRKRQES